MDNQAKLMLLRTQLFTAAQTLTGGDLAVFWSMIDDVQAVRPAS